MVWVEKLFPDIVFVFARYHLGIVGIFNVISLLGVFPDFQTLLR